MPWIPFKFKKANAPTRLADFDTQPTWGDIASKIAKLFDIPLKDVGVAFVDKHKDAVTLNNEQDLQCFYKSLDQSSEEIKFVVQDLRTPDAETTITSAWSMDSNLSELSQGAGDFKLFCWVLGQSDRPFSVKIGGDETVDDLKKEIKKQNEHTFAGIDAYTLDLWKLSKPIPSPELGAKLGHVRSPEKIFGSVQLDPVDELSEHFLSPPPKHLHVIVQIPVIPSLKRSRSVTEEGGRAAKRREVEEASETRNKAGVAPDIQTRCVAIHEAIKAMPDLDLSNPSTFTMLPFPSLLSMPYQRFEGKDIDNMNHFEYMGRDRFCELQKRIQGVNFLKGDETIYLYGTSGSGKSHLLAALAYNLVREGRRVFYIPDCSTLLLEPERTLWKALSFAFFDSAALATVGNPYDVNALIRFISEHQDLYIIVDQVNALECAESDSRMAKKVQVMDWLYALRFEHRHVFSASANETSNREADRKQSGIPLMRIFGGMSTDETDQWFTHYGHRVPLLSGEQRLLVEYLTGRIPLLLRCLFDVESFDESEFKNTVALKQVAVDVDIFFTAKFLSLDHLHSKQRYLNMMRNCVMRDFVSIDDRSLYDLRYFHVDQESVGSFTCGIAFETMMSLLRTHDNAPFLDDAWYSAVSRSTNPIVRGFLAEQICLSNIATNGLQIVHPKLGRMSTTIFDTRPNFTDFLSSDHETRVFVPTAYNFRAVDGVILLLDRSSKQATMFSIQFTLSRNHKQSDKDFHTKLWLRWTEPITTAGYSIQTTFVWIDKKQPSEHAEPKLVKSLRSGDRTVHPDYLVVHVGVEMVDPRLASALGIKQ